MDFILKSTHLYRTNSYNKNKLSSIPKRSQSIAVRTIKSKNDTPANNHIIYRTEAYLQQREKQDEDKSSSSSSATITTWKNLKNRKRIIDNDQAEIDRVLSTMDSIHGVFNRSLLLPYNQVYSSLYGDDDQSACLMRTFCQRQDYYLNYNDDSDTQEISDSFKYFQDTDLDDGSDGEEEENEEEKKKSYDSGYGSVMPIKHFSRESFLKIAQPLSIN